MALVLVPGFMVDKDLWADFEQGMEEFGPIIHADLTQDDSIAAMARRIIADAPLHFVIMGFSMGGYVAREVARLAPDRVRALVLVATSSRGDTTEQIERKAVAINLSSQQPFKGLSGRAIRESLDPARTSDSHLINRIRNMGIRLGSEVFLRQSSLVRESDVERLSGIHCPTLIVAGQNDLIRSLDEARELNDRIPNSTLQVVPLSGHMIPMEQPFPLADLVRLWLIKELEAPDRNL
ncbi:MAG: alpha/beta hydrolase [Xanthobacteraceae bacterium]